MLKFKLLSCVASMVFYDMSIYFCRILKKKKSFFFFFVRKLNYAEISRHGRGGIGFFLSLFSYYLLVVVIEGYSSRKKKKRKKKKKHNYFFFHYISLYVLPKGIVISFYLFFLLFFPSYSGICLLTLLYFAKG